ncbi:hypothetical protein ACLOJK_034904, partial [Asimina triloba]
MADPGMAAPSHPCLPPADPLVASSLPKRRSTVSTAVPNPSKPHSEPRFTPDFVKPIS